MLQILFGIILVFIIYYYTVKPMKYWKKKGVKQTTPYWLFGNSFSFICRLKSLTDFLQECYREHKNERYFGIYLFTAPILVIRDPDLIKQIAIRDCQHFADHVQMVPVNDPLWSKNLISLSGQKWHDMRPIVSSNFTNSKMKAMFVLISEAAQTFVEYVTKKHGLFEFEAESFLSRFSADVISSTAFGFKTNSLQDPNNEFYKTGKGVSSISSLRANLVMIGQILCPKLCEALDIQFFSKKDRLFFMNIINNNVKEREEQGIIRPDLVNLLLQARKGIKTKNENDTPDVNTGKSVQNEITNVDIAAHAVVFIIAGFDSNTTLAAFMSYELAVQPDIQDKLRKEIRDTFKKVGGNLTYEALNKMKYMDMVISETMRKWLNFTVTDRLCTKTYVIEPQTANETALTLEPGTRIWFPIHAIHNDPEYYEDPDKFDPERFSDENKSKINISTYFPFGIGPRICVGPKFAYLQTKILFYYLLLNMEIVVTAKTKIPPQRARNGIGFTSAEGGLHLGLKVIKNV
ncbi:unnamed protein product [Phyllotreta striolata]|uniref:Cytochrome P450 n=1 Tax=Phyllotreta striolata TaxID=444603 RepID=A0A9N9XHX2_PHYSR|nr:unnamed protein product [Phyllotreta striolata]